MTKNDRMGDFLFRVAELKLNEVDDDILEDLIHEAKEVLAEVGLMVHCKFCHELTNVRTAHLHQGEYVGDDCCWDERLRSSE